MIHPWATTRNCRHPENDGPGMCDLPLISNMRSGGLQKVIEELGVGPARVGLGLRPAGKQWKMKRLVGTVEEGSGIWVSLGGIGDTLGGS